MTPWRMIRSILCTPTLDVDRFEKCREVGADLAFLDLEDGVPEAEKCASRQRLVKYLKQKDETHLVGLRINSLQERDGFRDLLELIEHDARPDLLVLPKLESPDEVRVVDRLLTTEGWETKLCPVIENAQALQQAEAIAACTPRVVALIFGSADFCADLGIDLIWENLLHVRQRLAIVAAACDVALYDAPYFDLNEPEELERESQMSAQMGFCGKAVLHPNQVEIVNRIFRPCHRRITEAQRVIDAYEAAGGEICAVNGQLIGPPFYKQAKRILERSATAPLKQS